MLVAPLTVTVLSLALAGTSVTAASADQAYTVTGSDDFSIGPGDITSEVAYRGVETLHVSKRGRVTRYSVHVVYTRSDAGAQSEATADYVADVSASGEMLDSADKDPDYLTVLNQPFAAQLDPQTLADLHRLDGQLPFDFPSPFTGSSLHGYLEHVASAPVDKRRSTGVRFEAAGTMHGRLPDRRSLTLEGTIAMRGTAFYDTKTALLLALDTTVTIAGNVSNRTSKDPVRIVYSRSLRAGVASPVGRRDRDGKGSRDPIVEAPRLPLF